VKPEAAFVRTECTAEFESETAVDLNIASVILPWDAEYDLSFWFNQTLKNACIIVFRMLVKYRFKRQYYFPHSLQKFQFPGVAILYGIENLLN
jgi:hypothetical protein